MDLIKIAAFLKRRIEKLRGANGRRARENLLMWLAWHTSRYNATSVVLNGKIIAVGVARAIDKPEDARIPYISNEEGKICYVEQVASDTEGGMRSLLGYVQKRWSQCDKIMFNRSGKPPKIYDMENFMRKAGI